MRTMTEKSTPVLLAEPAQAQAPAAERADRALGRFLKVGVVVLALALAGVGVLYFLDQRAPAAPSIVDQQIARAEDAVRQAPNNVPARLALGVLYQDKNRPDDALAQYGEILKVAPGNTDARLGKGYILLQRGDLAGATTEYVAITGTNRTGEFAGADTRLEAAYYYLGLIAVKQQQPAKALDQLGLALRISPTDSDALYQVALAQAQLNKHTAAITTLRKALTFVPTGWCTPYEQMASSFTALGQPEEAGYAEAMNLYCSHKPTEAKTQLDGLADGPAGLDAMLGLGLIAQVDKDTDTAIAWYRKALAKDPKNITAMSGLAALGVAPDSAGPKEKK
jgi:tetratricopeptide (TPR) repeat protein